VKVVFDLISLLKR